MRGRTKDVSKDGAERGERLNGRVRIALWCVGVFPVQRLKVLHWFWENLRVIPSNEAV